MRRNPRGTLVLGLNPSPEDLSKRGRPKQEKEQGKEACVKVVVPTIG